MVEPWMSGTLTEVPPVLRAVLHTFEHARIELEAVTEPLSTEELWTQPGVASIGFHLRHIAGSVDRLFTYARGEALSTGQLERLKHESSPGADREELLAELRDTLDRVGAKIRAIDPATLHEVRTVGRKRLPTTLAGLLIHIAEHTQRHVGQAVTTARIVAPKQY